jgi:hypothetical protein
MQAVKGSSMEKWFCWGGLGTAGLLLLLFLLDLIIEIPFGRLSPTLDVLVILASGILAYLSFNALRELP